MTSMKNINVIIGKNNSGKTTILESLYRILNTTAENNHEILKYKVELNAQEFFNIFNDFFQKFYALKDSKMRQVSVIKDVLLESTRGILRLIKQFKLKQRSGFVIDFNNQGKNDKLQININILNKKKILDKFQDNYIKEFFQSIKNFCDNLNSDWEGNIGFTNYLFNLLIPKGRILKIPCIRKLESSDVEYGRQDIDKSYAALKRIVKGDLDALTTGEKFDETNTSASRERLFSTQVFSIPNIVLILNRIKQGRLNEWVSDDSFVSDFFEDLNYFFPEIQLNIEQEEEFKLNVKFSEYNHELYDWTRLGNGTQQLMSFLFLLRIPGDYFYLIDEPENGLHPGLQIKLLQYIKEIVSERDPSKQFIFASHSTSFIDFQGSVSIYSCQKNAMSFYLEELSNNHFDNLRNLLGITPGYALQQNGIIWVEGPSDIIYLKIFLKCFDIDIDVDRIIMLPYNGRTFLEEKYFSLDLMKATNPNFVVLVDSDYDQSKQNMDNKLQVIKTEFENAGYDLFVIDKVRDFEGLIPQEVLNIYFHIKTPLSNEFHKKPFEKLKDYIERLKQNNLTRQNSPKFRKVRTAYQISNLLERNVNLQEFIVKDTYINELIKIIDTNFRNWLVNPSSKYFK